MNDALLQRIQMIITDFYEANITATEYTDTMAKQFAEKMLSAFKGHFVGYHHGPKHGMYHISFGMDELAAANSTTWMAADFSQFQSKKLHVEIDAHVWQIEPQ